MSVIERLLPSVTDKPMTLGRALKLAESYHKQNKRVLLKRESVYYYSEFEWNSKGRLRDVNVSGLIHDPRENAGYISLHGGAHLTYDVETICDKVWTVHDCTPFHLGMQSLGYLLSEIVRRQDVQNQYKMSHSAIVTKFMSRLNEDLKSKDIPCRLCLTDVPERSDEFVFVCDEEADHLSRGIATRIAHELLKTTEKELETAEERKIYEKHKPMLPLSIKRVNMAEFLRRINMSEFMRSELGLAGLWLVDAVNAHKQNSKGEVVRDWSRARLRPVTLSKDHYGGARTDRLAIRNRITNSIGLPHVAGREFYSLNDVDGTSGVFFADVVQGYGVDGEFVIIDGSAILEVVDNQSLPDPTSEVTMLLPTVKSAASYNAVRKILEKRFSSFEEWSK